jgi:predicted DNA-binding transcriptional regulator AlpA
MNSRAEEGQGEEGGLKRYLTKGEVATMVGLHPRSINRYVDRGDLPRPIYLDSKRRVPRWSSSDLRDWQEKKRRENDHP